MVSSHRERERSGESKIMRIVRARFGGGEILKKDNTQQYNLSGQMMKQSKSYAKLDLKNNVIGNSLAAQPKQVKEEVDLMVLYNSSVGSPISDKNINSQLSQTLSNRKNNHYSNHWVDRLVQDDQRRKAFKQKLEEQKKENDLKEVQRNPYKPILMSAERKKNQGNNQENSEQRKRAFQTFYEDQIEFKNKIDIALQNKRDEEYIKDITHAKAAHVKPSKNSLLLVERFKAASNQREGTPEVHERLYNNIPLNSGSKKRSKVNSLYQQKSPLLQPKKVSLYDQQRAVERLFTEGQSRDEKRKELLDKWESIGSMISTNKDFNNKTLYSKLKKDFAEFFNKDMPLLTNNSEVFYEDGISPLGAQKTCGPFSPQFSLDTEKLGKNTLESLKRGTPIKLKTFIKLMHTLGFIHVKNRSASEEELLTEVWKILGGTNQNTIKAENLFVLLAGIINAQLPDIVQIHQNNQNNKHQKIGILCYDEYNNAHFTSYESIIKLNQKFMSLAINRKNHKKRNASNSQGAQLNNYSPQSNGHDQKFSFTPKIDPKSKSIAEARFKEQLKQMSHHEYLLQQANEKKKLKKKLSDEFIKRELEQCPFKPNLISQRSRKQSSNHRNDSSGSKTPQDLKDVNHQSLINQLNQSNYEQSSPVKQKQQYFSPIKQSPYNPALKPDSFSNALNSSGDQLIRPS